MKDNTITLKEIYERVVALEVQIENLENKRKEDVSLFIKLAGAIIVLEFVNIFVHLLV